MSRRSRKGGSDLYQVDFVAALFGGFLLIWLTGVGEREVRGENGHNPTIFELSAKANFVNSSGLMKSLAVLPNTTVRMGCAHDSLVSRLRSNSASVMACRADSTEALQIPRSENDSYKGMVIGARRTETNPDTILAAFGIDIALIYKSGETFKSAAFAGLALERDPHTGELYQVGIGIVPETDIDLTTIHANRPRLFGVARLSVPSKMDNSGKVPQLTALDGYFFDEINSTVIPSDGFNQLTGIVYRVRIDPANGGRCYFASSDGDVVGDLKLTNGPCSDW